MMKITNMGYTLIELLIVMSIVAVLSSISIFALQGARESARDGQRKGDLEAIRSALELYKSDCDVYPPGNNNFVSVVGAQFDDSDGGCGGTGARVYLTNVPVDPRGGDYWYIRGATGFTYEICADLEVVPSVTNNCGGHGNYRVTSP